MARLRFAPPAFFLLAVFIPGAAHAYDTGCATPQSAMYNLFHFSEPETASEKRVDDCFDLSRVDASEGPALARKLKGYLDARDIFVELDKLSTNPNFVNENGESRQLIDPRVPELELVKSGERGWLVSADSVARVPALFDSAVVIDVDSLMSSLPPWATERLFGVPTYKYAAILILIFIAVVIRFLLTVVLVSQGRKVMSKLRVTWGHELLSRVGRPIGTLGAAGFVALSLPSLVLPIRLGKIFLLATQVVAVFSVVWAFYRMVDLFSQWMAQRAAATETKLDDQLVPLVRKALKIFTVAMGSIFILQNLNVDVAGLLAGLGIGGLAFALAAKDTVANLFGSATIFADRPFHVGDWISVMGVDGTVEQVGFRSTKIRTFYDSLVSVPNAKLADSVIDNYGERTARRCSMTLGLTYDTPAEHMQAFVEGIRAILRANDFTVKNRYEVHFKEYGASSLGVLVYFFLEVPSWSIELRERHNIFLEILRLAEELGVAFAFPTQTLHIESLAQPGQPFHIERPSAEELRGRVESFGPGGRLAQPRGRKVSDGFLPG